MKLNSISYSFGGYEVPAFPQEPHGPEILAEMLVHGRQFSMTIHDGDSGWLAPLTDDGVRELVKLAYYASLLPEEGRFSRFKLASGLPSLVSRIDPVVLDGADSLRRLARACTNPACALLVAERDGQLLCEGVVDVGSRGFGWSPGYPGVIPVGSNPNLQIEVFGPAHLRVKETTSQSYEIRAGKVRTLCPYDIRDATRRLRDAVKERVFRDVVPVIGEKFSKEIAIDDERPTLLVLSRLLRRAVEARHGGAFLFLPTAPSAEEDFGLNILYPTTVLDLGDNLVEQWKAYADVVNNCGKPEYEQAIRMAEILRSKMLTDSEAVANFSAVDGCVVLTHDFKVLGFGAKIVISSEMAEQCPR